jgi:hypothetical protein
MEGSPFAAARLTLRSAVTTRSPSPSSVTRRHLVLMVPATALALATACKKGPPASCGDQSSLSPDDLTARKALAYTDRSTDPAQLCIKCRQYVPGPSEDACGTCKVMKGPIHPNGTCRAFAGM